MASHRADDQDARETDWVSTLDATYPGVMWGNVSAQDAGIIDDALQRLDARDALRTFAERGIFAGVRYLLRANLVNSQDVTLTGVIRRSLPLLDVVDHRPTVPFLNRMVILASSRGSLDVVKRLVSCPGVDPMSDGNKAIVHASRNGYLDVVEFLSSWPINTLSEEDKPIVFASMNGHLDVVEYLMSSLPVSSLDDATFVQYMSKAILLASASGHLDVVKYLMSYVTKDGLENLSIGWRLHTARIRAVENGRLDVVEYLSAIPAVEMTGTENDTFLCAAGHGHVDIVRFLASTPLFRRVTQGDVAIGHATARGDLDMLKCLVSLGIDPAIESEHPIQIAMAREYLDVVKYLSRFSAIGRGAITEKMPAALLSGNTRLLEFVMSDSMEQLQPPRGWR